MKPCKNCNCNADSCTCERLEAYQDGKADAIDGCKEILRSAIAEDGQTKCTVYLKALNEMEQIKGEKE